jgi:transposase
VCIYCCLSHSFYSWTTHHDQEASWGGKGLFSLHFHIAVHHQRKSGLELNQVRKQERHRGHEGMLLTGFLPLACSAWSLIEPRLPAQRWHHPQGDHLLVHYLRKCFIAGYREGTFPTEAPFSVITPTCVKLTQN